MDLYIPDESPSDNGKDTCDYDAMTTRAFKQPEPDECYCDAMNHHDNPHNCDPMYMKKMKPMNMTIWSFNAYIDELFLDCAFHNRLEIIFRYLNI